MRYFLDKNGAKTLRARGQPGEGHVDIGREILSQRGVRPNDMLDVYTQVFRLGFARVVEHPNNLLEVESKRGRLTSGQKRYVDGMVAAGWTTKIVDADGRRLAPGSAQETAS